MSRRLLNQPIRKVTWEEFDKAVDVLEQKIKQHMKESGKNYIGVYGIPRGGVTLAVRLSHRLGIPLTQHFYQEDIILCDEIADEGKTLYFYTKNNFDSVLTVVWHKRKRCKIEPDIYVEEIDNLDWVEYGWER